MKNLPQIAIVLFALAGGARNYLLKKNTETSSDFANSIGMFGGGEDFNNDSLSATMVKLTPMTALAFNAPEDSGVLFCGKTVFANPNNPCYDISLLNNAREIKKYIVREGDTVSSIAQSFGVSVNTIVWENNLPSSNVIKLGDILNILPVSGVKHTVKEGDTLETIAKKYNVTLESIIKYNALSDNNIALSDTLILPNGTLPTKRIASTVILKNAPSYTTAGQSSGYFIYPAAGHNWGTIHANNGVDISNPKGGPIYAAAEGTVILADGIGYNGGYGQYIKIEHPNGVITLYAHLSKINVKVGEWVQQGSVIGMMGSTGRSTGTHLHFEVRGAKNPLAKY